MTDWELRAPAVELADAYRRAGWWNDDSLGQLVERGLRAAPGVPVRIWSTNAAVVGHPRRPPRPLGPVRRGAPPPRCRTGRCRRGAAAELDRGRRDVVREQHARRGGRPDRALLRHERAVLHHARITRPRPRGRRSFRFRRPPRQPGGGAPRARRAGARRAGRRPMSCGCDALRRSPRRRPTRHVGDRRSREPRGRRVHLGHERQPEGGHPVAPFARRRGADPHGDARPTRSAARAPRRADQPRHRHAARAPPPGIVRRTDPPDRRVGPGRRARRRAVRRSLGGQRRDRVPHQPARPSVVLRRPPRA